MEVAVARDGWGGDVVSLNGAKVVGRGAGPAVGSLGGAK